MVDALPSLIPYLQIPFHWERLLVVLLVSDFGKELKVGSLKSTWTPRLTHPSCSSALSLWRLNELSPREDVPAARSAYLTLSFNLEYISTQDKRSRSSVGLALSHPKPFRRELA